jgi:protein-L-isoaspartate(D-aspartate) O-methyltransferase
MTTVPDPGWRAKAAQLADLLTERGDITDPAWRTAFAETPRHTLVPVALRQSPMSADWEEVDTAEDLAYSPATLVTQVDHGHAVSSSTAPGLMARMLHALRLEPGMRVLEIGTGTGYNAALLTHRLGDDNVYSVDVDPALVATARDRLAAIGSRPTLVAADGAAGLPDHAPYDRIIATCSVPAVPWAWAEQITEGGRVLVDLKVNGAGNLVDLVRLPDRLEGRFTARWAGFMTMRGDPAPQPPPTDLAPGGVERPTDAPPTPWSTHLVAWLLAALRLPPGVTTGAWLAQGRPVAARLAAPDGSWARIPLDGGHVVEAGPTRLWAAVEAGLAEWHDLGQPDWTRLGLTATAERQWVWCDDPAGRHTWPLAARLR